MPAEVAISKYSASNQREFASLNAKPNGALGFVAGSSTANGFTTGGDATLTADALGADAGAAQPIENCANTRLNAILMQNPRVIEPGKRQAKRRR